MSKYTIQKIYNPIDEEIISTNLFFLNDNDKKKLVEVLSEQDINFSNVIIFLNEQKVSDLENCYIKKNDKIVIVRRISGDSNPLRVVGTIFVIAAAAYVAPMLVPGVISSLPVIGHAATIAVGAGLTYAGMRVIDHFFPIEAPETNQTKSPSYSSHAWTESNPNYEGLFVPIVFGRVRFKPPIVSSKVEQTNYVKSYKHEDGTYKIEISPKKINVKSRHRFLKKAVEGVSEKVEYQAENSLLMRILIADNEINNIEKVFINNKDLEEHFRNVYDLWLDEFERNGFDNNADFKVIPADDFYEMLLLRYRHGELRMVEHGLSKNDNAYRNAPEECGYLVGYEDEVVDQICGRRESHYFKYFHQAGGFTDYYTAKAYPETNGNILIKELPSTTHSFPSSVFDKKLYNIKLNKSPNDFEEVTPNQGNLVNKGNKRFVTFSLIFPKGLYKIEESSGDSTILKQKFNVEVAINQYPEDENAWSAWVNWGTIEVAGNVAETCSVEIGPFNGFKTIEDVCSDIGYNYYLPYDDYPVLNHNIKMRIKYHDDTEDDRLVINDAVIGAVYSYYDYELNQFPDNYFMDLRLSASSIAEGQSPQVEMVGNAEKIYLRRPGTNYVDSIKPGNNPAWQIVKLLTDEEFGEGEAFKNINWGAFEQWADFCNEEGITSNIVIDSEGSFADKTNPIYTIGRAFPVRVGSVHSVIIDKPAPVTMTFDDTNIIKDSFSVTYLSLEDQVNVFCLEYRDEDLEFKSKKIMWRHPDVNSWSKSENRMDFVLNNCTNSTLARKHLAYMANKNLHLNTICTFSAYLDSINCQLGDVVEVSNSNVKWSICSGRILNKIGDKEYSFGNNFKFEPDKSYKAMVRDIKTDNILILSVGNKFYDNDYIYDPDIESIPIVFTDLEDGVEISEDSAVTIGIDDKVGKLFRITNITRKSNFVREITGIEYHEEVYNTDNIIIEELDDDYIGVDTPQIVSVDEIFTEEISASKLLVSWTGEGIATLVRVLSVKDENSSYLDSTLISKKWCYNNNALIKIDEDLFVEGSNLLKISVSINGSGGPEDSVFYEYKGYPDQLDYTPAVQFFAENNNIFRFKLEPEYPIFIKNIEITVLYTNPENEKYQIFRYTREVAREFQIELKEDFLSTNYTVFLQPVTASGKKYQPISLEKNFYIDNIDECEVLDLDILNVTSNWINADVKIAWDALDLTAEQLSNIKYHIHIFDQNDVKLREDFVFTNKYTYTIEKNRADTTLNPKAFLKFKVVATNLQTFQKSKNPGFHQTECPALSLPVISKEKLINGVKVSIDDNYDYIFDSFLVSSNISKTDTEPSPWSGIYKRTNELTQSFFISESQIDSGYRYIFVRVKSFDIFGRETGYVQISSTVVVFSQNTMEIDDFSINASKMFTKIPVVEADEWTSNHDTGIVSWNAHRLYYNGKKFNIASGSSGDKYIYFELPDGVDFDDDSITEYDTAYLTNNVHPRDLKSLSDQKFFSIIAVNIDGYYQIAWNAIANEVIGSANIMKAAIKDAHIDVLEADKIITKTKKYPNQLLPATWVPGTTGSQEFYNQNGSSQENSIIYDLDPRGQISSIWQAECDDVYNADGGFKTDYVKVDNTKNYRFSVFVKKEDVEGRLYFGCYSSVIDVYTGTEINNPYFYAGNLPELNKWYLIIGNLYHKDFNSSQWSLDITTGGIYDLDTGEKIRNIQQEFKFLPDQVHIKHRAYYYYSTIPGKKVWFWQPRIDLLDGNEPSINTLIGKTLGQTIIQGGKIKSDFLEISESVIIGTIPKSKLDSSLETISGAQAKANQSQINSIDFTQTWCEEGADVTNYDDYRVSNNLIDWILPSDEGLIGYWSFDDGSAKDNSGNGNDGTVNGVTLTNGISGKAMDFNSINSDYIGLNQIPCLTISDTFTISLWILARSAQNSNPRLFSMTDSEGWKLSLNLYGRTKPNLYIYDGATYRNYTSITGITYDYIHHVCVSYNEANVLIYIDGVLCEINNTGVSSPSSLNGIGVYTGESFGADGIIDEVRIYNKVLTEKEVRGLYKNPSGLSSGIQADQYAKAQANQAEINAAFFTQNWCEKGADKTQEILDLGADISNAKANDQTLIEGGYINTSIINAGKIVSLGKYSFSDNFFPIWDPDIQPENQAFYKMVNGTELSCIEPDIDPFGDTSFIYKLKVDLDHLKANITSGFNWNFVKHTEKYRFSCFIKQKGRVASWQTGSSRLTTQPYKGFKLSQEDTTGNELCGWHWGGYGVLDDLNLPENDKWYLLIDYIYPSDFDRQNWSPYMDNSGLYDADTGELVMALGFEGCKFGEQPYHPGEIDARFYAELKLHTTKDGAISEGLTSAEWHLYMPRFDMVNGREVSINDLLNKPFETTIIEGGKIRTKYLTADNIKTGTLDASQVNVQNINASNIKTGILQSVDSKIKLDLTDSSQGLTIQGDGVLNLKGIDGGKLKVFDNNKAIGFLSCTDFNSSAAVTLKGIYNSSNNKYPSLYLANYDEIMLGCPNQLRFTGAPTRSYSFLSMNGRESISNISLYSYKLSNNKLASISLDNGEIEIKTDTDTWVFKPGGLYVNGVRKIIA